MSKVGNTDNFTLTCLHQYFTVIAWGGEVKMSAPHPDVKDNWSAATFSVASECGDAKPDPDVIQALKLMARMTWAVGCGQTIHVESIPVEGGDEETKYTVTIKKRQSTNFQVLTDHP